MTEATSDQVKTESLSGSTRHIWFSSFSPFSDYDFAKTRKGLEKYGLAYGLLEARDKPDLQPFAPFDFRRCTAREFVAYWIKVARRLESDGLAIIRPLRNAMQDPASQHMLFALCATPLESVDDFPGRVRVCQQDLLRAEAERFRFIRKLALATFWDRSVLRHLPKELRGPAAARSAELWQQEYTPGALCNEPSPQFAVAADAAVVEIAAVCDFLSRLNKDGEPIDVECYLPRQLDWKNRRTLFHDRYLEFALSQASYHWLTKDFIRPNLVQREKALLADLERRMNALTAYFVDLLKGETDPYHLFHRLSSFWPEDVFDTWNEADDYHRMPAK